MHVFRAGVSFFRSSPKQSSASDRSKLFVVSNTVSPDSSFLMQSRRSEVLSESFNWLFPAAMGDKKSDPLQALINHKYLAHRPQTVVFDRQKDELEYGRFMLGVREYPPPKKFPTFDILIHTFWCKECKSMQEIKISLWLFARFLSAHAKKVIVG